MQFKHILYWGAVLCAVGQVILALYARFYGDVTSQITSVNLIEQVPQAGQSAITQALNYALPVGVACLALLVYTWKINSVGGVALGLAIGLQVIATDLSMRAVQHVYGAHVTLESVAWWYPKQQTVNSWIGG